MMLDLKKLEADLERVLNEETEESFSQWLEDKRQKEILSLLGNGEIEDKVLQCGILELESTISFFVPINKIYEAQVANKEYQLAKAA